MIYCTKSAKKNKYRAVSCNYFDLVSWNLTLLIFFWSVDNGRFVICHAAGMRQTGMNPICDLEPGC